MGTLGGDHRWTTIIIMAFIRKVKTTSGATAVQIAYKQKGKIIKIIHIGSAHTDEGLKILLALARKQLQQNQLPLFPETQTNLQVGIKRTFSDLLWKTLREQYQKLGFDQLNDDVFEALCLARIVEPSSKLDSLRVLADLGLRKLDQNKLYRCLAKAADSNYRKIISQACFEYVGGDGLRLILYDVTTLYFEIQEEDDYRKPGLSKERRLETQIIIGLLVDQRGFPLGLHSFEGNKSGNKDHCACNRSFSSPAWSKKDYHCGGCCHAECSKFGSLHGRWVHLHCGFTAS